MRFIKYTLIAVVASVAVALIVLLFLGGFRGRSRLVASVDINKPPSTVFRWISEPAKLKSWVGWLIDIRELNPSAAGAGARQVWVMEDRNNNNARMDIHTEVVKFEPDRLLEARVRGAEGFTGDVRYELEPMNATRTRFTYRANYQFEHWLAKLLEPLISRSAQQKLEEDIARLKQQVEAE